MKRFCQVTIGAVARDNGSVFQGAPLLRGRIKEQAVLRKAGMILDRLERDVRTVVSAEDSQLGIDHRSRRRGGHGGARQIRKPFPTMARRITPGVPQVFAYRFAFGPSRQLGPTEEIERSFVRPGDRQHPFRTGPGIELLPAGLWGIEIESPEGVEGGDVLGRLQPPAK